MCNLYALTKSREAIVRLFKVPHNRAATFEPVSAIFPGRSAPVIRPTYFRLRKRVAPCRWQFMLQCTMICSI
jgi:putative SOS response-associated peptidase YedK